MPTYVAFLRAINLGAKRKFPKDAIRASAEGAGFTDVETYLNTGNVRVRTSLRSLPRVEAALEAAFAQDRGFEVPTIVFGLPELSEVVARAGELGERHGPLERHYITLLRDPLPSATAAEIEAESSEAVHIVVHGRSVHLMWRHAVPGDVDPLGAAAARKLGLGSARTARVLAELTRRWG